MKTLQRTLVGTLLLGLLVSNILAITPAAYAAGELISTGRFSENANGDGAPSSKSEIYGNIKKVQVKQSASGKVVVTVDYWGIPNSRYTTHISWCYQLSEFRHDVYLGDNLSFLCASDHMDDYVVFFEPSLSKKGSQLGLRKDYKGTSTKGANKNQWIYTLSSKKFANNPIAGLAINTYYSSISVEQVTTTCSGSYSITCRTDRSSVFDVDQVLIEMSSVETEQMDPTPSKATDSTGSSTATSGSGNKVVQDYFDRIKGEYVRSTHKFQVTCINDAPRNGSVSGLKLYLALSTGDGRFTTGSQNFPSQYTGEFAGKIKTYPQAPSFNYIELDFTSPNANSNPCGLIATYVPPLQSIGSDVMSAMFLVGSPTGFAVANTKVFSALDIG
ncbi:MAG: hypothetical protein NTV53_03520 [Actinobacteria bacterium]|nr:hypothetical protein [Actinomycetota bacterium]